MIIKSIPPPLSPEVGSTMAHQATPSSQKALMMELKSLQEQPVEGFRITLVEESDLYNWEVAIFGPPNTLYEGGYFKVGDTTYDPPAHGRVIGPSKKCAQVAGALEQGTECLYLHFQ